MAEQVRTSRSRGTVCGFLLVLIGGWAGIAPFAGPALRFGYTPDQAWAYTQGRVYLSAVPGGLAVLAGLVLLGTRSRGFGGFCASIAALGGAWLIVGAAVIVLLPARVAASVGTGTVIGAGAHRAIMTSLAFFAGPGMLIIFVAAIALGRFSIVAYKDYLRWPPPEDTGRIGLAGIGLSSAIGPDYPDYGRYAGPSAQTQELSGPVALTQDWPQNQPQPGQDNPGFIGPGGRLERTYPPDEPPTQG